jgi:hypothetical protein
MLEWVLLPLAANSLTETVTHGSTWARGVGEWAKKASGDSSGTWYRRGAVMPLGALGCPFCFSHWAAAAVVALLFCGDFGLAVLLWLNTTRAAQLINDAVYGFTRTHTPKEPSQVAQELPDDIFEAECIRRTGRSFGVSPGAVPGTVRPQDPKEETSAYPHGDNFPETEATCGAMDDTGESGVYDGSNPSAIWRAPRHPHHRG